jgi:hypothetical protein
VNGLERTLAGLAREVDVPPAPDLAGAVAARLTPRRAYRRRLLLVALAALVLVGAVLAIPPARSAIGRLFGFGGVEIRRVDSLPPVTLQAPLDLGELTTLTAAQREVFFNVLTSKTYPPERVYLGSTPAGGRVSFLYGPRSHPRLLVTEFLARTMPFAAKLAGPGTVVERVSVDGRPGVWVHGSPHVFYFLGADGVVHPEQLRLVGNVLLWQVGNLTLRLEGDVSKADAVQIAATFE